MIFKNLVEGMWEVKKVLKIRTEILGVDYSDVNDAGGVCRRDTACTAIARSLKKKEITVIYNSSHAQLCPGGDYFLKIREIDDAEAIDVYVNIERVFDHNDACKIFLKSLPEFPEALCGKNIIIGPLSMIKNPMVIIFLVTPAQANRLLGLLNFKKFTEIKIIPNQPTCVSLFAPLVNQQPHINMIDYYDRYHQGVVSGKKIWPEGKMIVSITSDQFAEICDNLNKSPQGNFIPDLRPQKVDDI